MASRVFLCQRSEGAVVFDVLSEARDKSRLAEGGRSSSSTPAEQARGSVIDKKGRGRRSLLLAVGASVLCLFFLCLWL